MNPIAQAILAAVMAVPPRTVHLDDLSRFPSQWMCIDAIAFIQDHESWLYARLKIDLLNEDALTDWQWDVGRRREAWTALEAAHRKSSTAPGRRNRLRELRRLIGPEAYAAGRMPLPVPLERFRRLE